MAETPESVASFMDLARRRAARSYEASLNNRKMAQESLKFIAGEQWDERVRRDREEKENLPCLTMNITKKFLKQVVNEIRQMRPSVRVSPVDDQSDPKTAEMYQGLIRHVERNSNAEMAYDVAAERGAGGGFGYCRFITEYVDDDSFDQEILVKAVLNPLAVYGDPDGVEPDGSDWKFAFIVEDLSEEEFKERYPSAALTGINFLGDFWKVASKKIRTAEYFYIQSEKKNLYLLDDGQNEIVADDEKKKALLKLSKENGLPEPTVKQHRQVIVRNVKWAKISGAEILEGNEEKTEGKDWPGKWIPIVQVLGDADLVDGEIILRGLTYDAEDPQRMVNYLASYLAQNIALTPKNPWTVAVESIEGFEKEWGESNKTVLAYLKYRAYDNAGRPLPFPKREFSEPPIAALSNALLLFSENVKSTIGLYGPSIGEPSGEKSGVAIRERKQQGNMATFHFGDNLARSMRFVGRQLVDLIPKIYDRPGRVTRIIGDDGTEKTVRLDSNIQKPYMERQGEQGVVSIYNPGIGKYDVDVYMGPSFATKRQEAVDSMVQMSGQDKNLMAVAGDLVYKNMDWPYAQEISDRVRRTIPANILEDENDSDKQLSPQAKAQMNQMANLINQLSDELDKATQTIREKKIEIQSKEKLVMAELASKERIERLRAVADLIKLRSELSSQEDMNDVRDKIQSLLASGNGTSSPKAVASEAE